MSIKIVKKEKDFSLYRGFKEIWLSCALLGADLLMFFVIGVYWASWIYEFTVFIHFRKIRLLFLQTIFLSPFSFPWGSPVTSLAYFRLPKRQTSVAQRWGVKKEHNWSLIHPCRGDGGRKGAGETANRTCQMERPRGSLFTRHQHWPRGFRWVPLPFWIFVFSAVKFGNCSQWYSRFLPTYTSFGSWKSLVEERQRKDSCPHLHWYPLTSILRVRNWNNWSSLELANKIIWSNPLTENN